MLEGADVVFEFGSRCATFSRKNRNGGPKLRYEYAEPQRGTDTQEKKKKLKIPYRQIAERAGFWLFVSGLSLYLLSPNYFSRLVNQAVAGISGGLLQAATPDDSSLNRQAHFLNLYGEVRVRKANSTQWATADYRMTLGKGDFVQTGHTALARIIFADGSTYLLKEQTLISIEESMQDPVTRATRVAVQLTSGAVDLSTGRMEVPGSTMEVSFSDGVARLTQHSEAVVLNDAARDIHQISLTQGEAEVRRGRQTVQLAQFERASFSGKTKELVKERDLAPPKLASPVHGTPIFSRNPQDTILRFAWTPVAQATRYRLRVSSSGMLVPPLVDRIVRRTSLRTAGLEEGTYDWVVSAFDVRGKESRESKPSRFSLIHGTDSNPAPPPRRVARAAPKPAVKPPSPMEEKKPVRVGGNISPPRRIREVRPKYPVQAKRKGIEGEVILEATINEKGRVVESRALSGHPLLVPAAIQAVSKWRYVPTILNGIPWPVLLKVTVTFSLSNP